MNRVKKTQWGFTFPQSGDFTKDEFVRAMPPCKEIIVGREYHDDGNPHLHAFVKLKKALNFKAMQRWIESKFPYDYQRIKYEGVRNRTNWVNYIKGEDPEPLVLQESWAESWAEKHPRLAALVADSYEYLGDDVPPELTPYRSEAP